MVDFRSADWQYVKHYIEELLSKQRANLEQTSRTYKEVIVSQAKIEVLKTLVNLPEFVKNLPPIKG